MKKTEPDHFLALASVQYLYRRKSRKGTIYTVVDTEDNQQSFVVYVDNKENVDSCSCGYDDKGRLCPHIKFIEKKRIRTEVVSTAIVLEEVTL